MSGNPFEPILKTLDSFSRCVQTQLSNLLSPLHNDYSLSSKTNPKPLPLFSLSSSKPSLKDEASLLQSVDVFSDSTSSSKGKSVSPLTKEELGRGTWALLHTIAAQYPDQPTRQQKRDAKELMAILSRLYPCKECADHFKDILKVAKRTCKMAAAIFSWTISFLNNYNNLYRVNPVQAGSQAEFSQWLCHVHNVVNRSLGKLTFPCQRVNARWGKLDCKDRACDVQGTSDLK